MVEVAQLPDQSTRRNESSMAELTIVFRLRFAVAVTIALTLLFAFEARDAFAEEGIPAEYIVQMDAGVTPAQGQQMVAELGGQVTTGDVPVINGFGAVLQDDAAEELVNSTGVRAVTPNAATAPAPAPTTPDPNNAVAESGGLRCPASNTTTLPSGLGRGSLLDVNPLNALPLLRQPLQVTTRADRAWQRATGRGVGVAVLDTGIAGDLPDFVTAGQSRVIASAVTNPCARNANDQVGHGTHVAGLIAGNSLNHPGLRKLTGKYMGIAPRANLVSVKVSDDDGDTTVLDVINGIQFVVDHKAEFGIRVMNLSLSSTVAESYKTDPLDAAVEAAWFSGITVVAAAGNDGIAPDSVSYAPGNDPYVISVGALDDRGSNRLDDDVLAPWSSRGVTQDGVRKPEVLAPGNRLVAPLAPNSDFERLCRRCMVSHSYFRLSGTSMASAVVSGVVALMLEKNPNLTPNQVKGAMVATLRNVPGAGAAVEANAALDGSGVANAGLVPNSLIDPATGVIDWARASFRRASFRDASGTPFSTSWTRASFRCDCGLDASGEVDQNRVSFRRVSFRRTVDFDR
jgi:serine protease AprX